MVAGGEQPRVLYLPQPTGGPPDGPARGRRVHHLVAGQCLSGELRREALGSQPQRDLAARQTFLAVDSPMAYAGVARGVQGAGRAHREVCPLQFPGNVPDARQPSEDLCGTGATFLAVVVGEVLLRVVVGHEAVVGGGDLPEALRSLEMVIREPPLHAKSRFYLELPRLALLDLDGCVPRPPRTRTDHASRGSRSR